MESIGASPETALELIAKVGELASQASALVAAAMTAPDTAALTGALGAVADALGEAAAALRTKKLAADVLLSARRAGEADGYEQGTAAAPKRDRRLALAAS
ncbi:MAG TPA: hypothetical protein VNH17_12725 [Streptosporangiaceae bacterium]|nr:hypothetical protein [Streptosporangiaceae bacterium]